MPFQHGWVKQAAVKSSQDKGPMVYISGIPITSWMHSSVYIWCAYQNKSNSRSPCWHTVLHCDAPRYLGPFTSTERLPYWYYTMHNFCWISNNTSGWRLHPLTFSSSTDMVNSPPLLLMSLVDRRCVLSQQIGWLCLQLDRLLSVAELSRLPPLKFGLTTKTQRLSFRVAVLQASLENVFTATIFLPIAL